MGVFREAIYGVRFGNERKGVIIERREEIVRCRDCKYFKEEPPDDAGFCTYWVDRAIYHDADGFCAWGERRERESAEVWNQWSADDVTCSEES